MLRKLAKALLCALFASLAVSHAGADIDYSALANPETYKNLDTTFRSDSGKALARIRLKSMNFESRVKKWGIPIPQTLLIRSLAVDVYCRNLGDGDLQKLKTPPLFFIAAENFSLTLYGKRNKMTLSADHALLKKDLTLVLTGNVKISTARGEMPLGSHATASLSGRMLKFSSGAGKFAVKF